jgi:hypothetical protein
MSGCSPSWSRHEHADAGRGVPYRRGWTGTVPQQLKQISSPNNSVIVVGRVFVENDSDLATAYYLAKQIHLAPPS